VSTTAQKIDLWSPASFGHGHPAEQYRWLRDNAPVYWHEEPGARGFWAVTRYDLVRQASVDFDTYSNSFGMTLWDITDEELPFLRQMMMFMDPPEHTAHRSLVSREFLPRAAARWTDIIAAQAADIIDSVRQRGECDLVTDVAGKLPSYVISQLLGIPREDGVRLYGWTETMHASPDAVTEQQRNEATQAMLGYCAEVHAAKLASPGDDLASKLAHAEVDGQRLEAGRYGLFILLLINAGGDTVRNLLGGGVLTLLSRPEQLARLRQELDTLLPLAVEELLRYQSPLIHMRRTALRDTTLGDQRVNEGDKVVLFYGAANRDERVFADPEEFTVDRKDNPHLAFGGHGPHYCLGSHFARIQATAMLREIVTQLPGLALSGEPAWLASSMISGPTHVPVTFTPTARQQA
jgi:cytochrome P450